MKNYWIILLLIFILVSCQHPPPKTSFMGEKPSTFDQLTGIIITQLEDFRRQHGYYAPQEGILRFRAIGLNAKEWEDVAYEGIIYDPRGSQIRLFPAKGYTIFIKDKNDRMRIVSHNLWWNIIYDLKSQAWYLERIHPDDRLKIETLTIKKDTSYRSEDYLEQLSNESK